MVGEEEAAEERGELGEAGEGAGGSGAEEKAGGSRAGTGQRPGVALEEWCAGPTGQRSECGEAELRGLWDEQFASALHPDSVFHFRNIRVIKAAPREPSSHKAERFYLGDVEGESVMSRTFGPRMFGRNVKKFFKAFAASAHHAMRGLNPTPSDIVNAGKSILSRARTRVGQLEEVREELRVLRLSAAEAGLPVDEADRNFAALVQEQLCLEGALGRGSQRPTPQPPKTAASSTATSGDAPRAKRARKGQAAAPKSPAEAQPRPPAPAHAPPPQAAAKHQGDDAKADEGPDGTLDISLHPSATPNEDINERWLEEPILLRYLVKRAQLSLVSTMKYFLDRLGSSESMVRTDDVILDMYTLLGSLRDSLLRHMEGGRRAGGGEEAAAEAGRAEAEAGRKLSSAEALGKACSMLVVTAGRLELVTELSEADAGAAETKAQQSRERWRRSIPSPKKLNLRLLGYVMSNALVSLETLMPSLPPGLKVGKLKRKLVMGERELIQLGESFPWELPASPLAAGTSGAGVPKEEKETAGQPAGRGSEGRGDHPKPALLHRVPPESQKGEMGEPKEEVVAGDVQLRPWAADVEFLLMSGQPYSVIQTAVEESGETVVTGRHVLTGDVLKQRLVSGASVPVPSHSRRDCQALRLAADGKTCDVRDVETGELLFGVAVPGKAAGVKFREAFHEFPDTLQVTVLEVAGKRVVE